MKRLIALLCACAIFFSALPAAFAANTSFTPHRLKPGAKVVLHVDKSLPLVQQSLMDILDEGLTSFPNKNAYYSGVWDEAQALYKAEAKRIMAATDLTELVSITPVGMDAGEITLKVLVQLVLLSDLDKSVVKKAADLTKLKTKLKTELVSEIKEYCLRPEFNDFYWDKIVGYKDEALADIASANTFTKYVDAESKWEYFFEFEPIDAEYADIYDYVGADVLRKEELTDFADLLANKLQLHIAGFKNMGYNTKKPGITAALSRYEAAAAKAEYANKIVKIFNNSLAEIAKEAGVDDSFQRAPATVSVKKRMFTRINNLFYTFNQSDYTEDGWDEMDEIYSDAIDWITACEYKDEISEKFYTGVQEKLKAVKTYAAQLKEYKAVYIARLRKFIDNKKYHQPKVKKYVATGTKLIQAAKTFEAAETVYERYLAALQKTVYTFKIVTAKVGKGTVTKTGIVKYGANFTVKIVPNAGYKIKSITVDGKKVKLTNAYTFKNVTKAHSMKVVFGG